MTNLHSWIRDDFPDYRLDASVIKNLKSSEKIDEAWELYDSVVLPMSVNEDLEFLEQTENKDKITLFANAGCALTCPSKICYVSMSKSNKGEDGVQLLAESEATGAARHGRFSPGAIHQAGLSPFQTAARPAGFGHGVLDRT